MNKSDQSINTPVKNINAPVKNINAVKSTEAVAQETGSVTERLVATALAQRPGELTAADIRMTKLCFLDWVGAAYAGQKEACVQQLLALDEAEGHQGGCTVLAQGKKTVPLAAAFINGTESHAIDFDDIHDFLSMHLTSPVFPAALAAAEQEGAGGKALLVSAINGVQVMTALAAGIMPEHYNKGRWHATGTLGIFGAAAAAGYLLKLTPEQMNNAFGIAAGMCSGIQLNFGTMAKPMCAGLAAKNGYLAALLARTGFTGKKDIFDTDFLCNISTKTAREEILQQIVERLAGPLAIHELRFKRYPCGAPTHSGIINCKKILAEHPFALEEVEKIVFEPYPRAIRLVGIQYPETGLQGKFSIPFTAAAQMVFGKVTMETFTDANVHDSRVVELLGKMTMAPNEEFNHSRGGKATIYLKDGQSFSNSTYLLGHPLDLAAAEPEVKEKFMEILTPRLGAARAEQLRNTLLGLEQLPRVQALSALL